MKANKKILTVLLMLPVAAIVLIALSVKAGAVQYGDPNYTFDEYMGATGVETELFKHSTDGFYLGTPYLLENFYQDPWLWIRPAGVYGASSRMNCTGFACAVFSRCGSSLSRVAQYGNIINAERWKSAFMNSGCVYHKFYSIDEALKSGVMRKGDLIYIEPAWGAGSYPDVDCHIGFFWGDTPSQNVFWHSLGYEGNHFSQIQYIGSFAAIYVIPIRHTNYGSIDLYVKDKNTSKPVQGVTFVAEGLENQGTYYFHSIQGGNRLEPTTSAVGWAMALSPKKPQNKYSLSYNNIPVGKYKVYMKADSASKYSVSPSYEIVTVTKGKITHLGTKYLTPKTGYLSLTVRDAYNKNTPVRGIKYIAEGLDGQGVYSFYAIQDGMLQPYTTAGGWAMALVPNSPDDPESLSYRGIPVGRYKVYEDGAVNDPSWNGGIPYKTRGSDYCFYLTVKYGQTTKAPWPFYDYPDVSGLALTAKTELDGVSSGTPGISFAVYTDAECTLPAKMLVAQGEGYAAEDVVFTTLDKETSTAWNGFWASYGSGRYSGGKVILGIPVGTYYIKPTGGVPLPGYQSDDVQLITVERGKYTNVFYNFK